MEPVSTFSPGSRVTTFKSRLSSLIVHIVRAGSGLPLSSPIYAAIGCWWNGLGYTEPLCRLLSMDEITSLRCTLLTLLLPESLSSWLIGSIALCCLWSRSWLLAAASLGLASFLWPEQVFKDSCALLSHYSVPWVCSASTWLSRYQHYNFYTITAIHIMIPEFDMIP